MENIGWFIILILPQAMKMAPLKLVWRGQKTKSCWTGTFRISLASPGKTVPTGKQADSIKPALSAIMTFGTCFIMQKTKKNAGQNRQVLQPQRIFFTGKDMKEIQ